MIGNGYSVQFVMDFEFIENILIPYLSFYLKFLEEVADVLFFVL